MNRLQIIIMLLILAALAAVGGWALQQAQISPPPAVLTLQNEPQPLPSLQLVDQNQQPFTEQSFQGQWNVLFFGFTHCPDICPNTMALLRELYPLMAEQAPKLVFVSLDPLRDTPAILKDYLAHFDERIVGITGTPKAIQALTVNLGIAYRIVPLGTDTDGNADTSNYTVDHSPWLAVIGPDGKLHAHLRPPHKPANIAEALVYLQSTL